MIAIASGYPGVVTSHRACAFRRGEHAASTRRRQRAAREYDWDPLVEKIAHTIAQRLGIQHPASGRLGAEEVLTGSLSLEPSEP